MAPETHLVHDYGNSKSARQIEEVLRTYGIVDPMRPFRTRATPRENLFASQESLEYYKKGYPSGNPFLVDQRKKEDLRLATFEDYEGIIPHAELMGSFLGNVIDGGISLLNFPQRILKNAVAFNAVVSMPIPSDRWHFRLELAHPMPENVPLEDRVEICGILLPLHDPQSDVKFEYTKKCVVCGKYYQAKGQKAIYCSERCRAHVRNQKKREEMKLNKE